MALSKINGTQHCMSKFVREQRKDFSNEITQEEVEEILSYMLNMDSFARQKFLIAQKKIKSLCCKSKDYVIEILESHAKKLCQQFCEKMVNGCSEEILNIYVSTWTSYDKFSRNVKTIFSPINKQIELESLVDYCNPSRKYEVEPSLALYNFMIRNWSVVIKETKDFLSDGFFASIEKCRERNEEIGNMDNILKKLHDSFDKLGLSDENDDVNEFYRMEIEQPILRKLEVHYAKEATKFLFLSDDDAIAKCSEILEQEKKILEKFLPLSAALISKRAWDIYVSDNINRFIERAKYYIEHEDFERLKIAQTCLMMSEDVYNKIQERQEQIFINLRETCETTKFCECFLKTYAQEHELLRAIFGSKPSFDALDEGVSRAFCKDLENVRSKTSKIVCGLRVSDILINDIDLFMRSGTNELLISKIEKKMEDVTFILKYIKDENRFNELYSARLAHRLFNSLCKSEEAEQKMIDEINVSLSRVENAYLKEVQQFYTQKSRKFVNALDAKDYVEKCLWLLEEKESKSRTLLSTSHDKILFVIRQILVFNNLDFINSQCRAIIEDQNLKALNNAYKLLHFDSEAIFHMLSEYQDHIEKKIEDAFKVNDVGLLVDSLAGLHVVQSKLIANNFSSDRGFFQSLDKGFRNAINRFSQGIEPSHQMSSSEILVTQCNNLLNDEKKGLNEIDGKLAEIITIFKYIEDKDVFIKLYSKALAMRLLHASSLSMEAEELMINKLKQECGYRFVRLLEKMVTDYHLSKDNTSKFNNGINLPISFSISIMQTGSWPIQACKLSPVIPQKLSLVMTKFNKFYHKNYSGRKLHWHHVLSSCDIKLNYLSKTCIVQTSVILTTILTIFNNVESTTFNEIKSSTEIDAKDLLKHLQFLATHKILLNGDGINPKVTEESTLSLNYKYESKKARIRLMPVLREAKQETKETTRAVLEDRKYFLQALIVRIMKAKKKSTHSDLVNEVIQESISNFVPTQVFIKNVIDCLIEKEYLTRVEGKSDMYHYLA